MKKVMSDDITDEKMVDKSKTFVNWIQEFSKKIVAITFIIFVIINIFILLLILSAYITSGELHYLDTLISEANLTFREVIGGYIIKAATENAIKIAGSIVIKYLDFISMKKYGSHISIEEDEIIEDDPMNNEEENE